MSVSGTQAQAGQAAIHSVDHFGLVAPDLNEAAKFYSAMGLEVHCEGEALGLYTAGNPHRWAVITQGPKKHIAFLSFGAYEADLPVFRARLEQHGVALMNAPEGGNPQGLWFRDPDGAPVQIFAAEKTSLDEKAPGQFRSAPAGARGAPRRSTKPFIRPLRFSHIALFTGNLPANEKFYTDILGLRVADRSANDLIFMHATHGSDHHVLAFVQSDGPGLHHCSWDMGSLEQIGQAAAQMAEQGFGEGWGPGRHVLGSNYFYYARDPWGSYAEMTADIDYIPAGTVWDSGDYPAEDAFYLWGPPPPEQFVVNFETAR